MLPSNAVRAMFVGGPLHGVNMVIEMTSRYRTLEWTDRPDQFRNRYHGYDDMPLVDSNVTQHDYYAVPFAHEPVVMLHQSLVLSNRGKAVINPTEKDPAPTTEGRG